MGGGRYFDRVNWKWKMKMKMKMKIIIIQDPPKPAASLTHPFAHFLTHASLAFLFGRVFMGASSPLLALAPDFSPTCSRMA